MYRIVSAIPFVSIRSAVRPVNAVVPLITRVVRWVGSMLRTGAPDVPQSATTSGPAPPVSGCWPSTEITLHAGESSCAGTIAQCVASRTGAAPGARRAPAAGGPSPAASAAAVSAVVAIVPACHAAASCSVEMSCVISNGLATRA